MQEGYQRTSSIQKFPKKKFYSPITRTSLRSSSLGFKGLNKNLFKQGFGNNAGHPLSSKNWAGFLKPDLIVGWQEKLDKLPAATLQAKGQIPTRWEQGNVGWTPFQRGKMCWGSPSSGVIYRNSVGNDATSSVAATGPQRTKPQWEEVQLDSMNWSHS